MQRIIQPFGIGIEIESEILGAHDYAKAKATK